MSIIPNGSILPTFPGRLTETGMTIAPGMAYCDWEEMLHRLMVMSDCAPWWLGDALLYGEHQFGEMYTQAVEVTGRRYQTLANYVYVCRSIPQAERRPGLSFSHHAEVASLQAAERAEWLQRAVAEDWSVNQLRQAKAEHREIVPEVPPVPEVAPPLARFFDGMDEPEQETLAATSSPAQVFAPHVYVGAAAIMRDSLEGEALETALVKLSALIPEGITTLPLFPDDITDTEVDAAIDADRNPVLPDAGDWVPTERQTSHREFDWLQRAIGQKCETAWPDATDESVLADLRTAVRALSMTNNAAQAGNCLLLLLQFAHRRGFSLACEAQSILERISL